MVGVANPLEHLARSVRYRCAQRFARVPIDVQLDRPIISFCFDDFPKSAAETGAELLNEQGVRGTFYYCADLAGQTINGIRHYDVADLQRLAEAGHELGCHTAGHTALGGLHSSSIMAEIDRNAVFLRQTGFPTQGTTFAYPFGDVSVHTKRVLSRRFKACRGVWAGVNGAGTDLSLLKTVCLEPHILAERSVNQWVDLAHIVGGWLIFTTHDVSEQHSRFGVSREDLKSYIRAAVASGAELLPIADAIDQISSLSSRTDKMLPRQNVAIEEAKSRLVMARDGIMIPQSSLN